MQRPSPSNAPPLDYLRPSPVRGQLEPPDPRTAKGWRYIQTTDTLDQLKVLLPPGTASMYEQLLKFEELELRKKSGMSWERILEIRHLKDRMIRKCQKLAKASAPARKPAERFELSFQAIVAPADFRVKAMEKWFLEQQKRTLALLRQKQHATRPPNPCRCMKCMGPTGLQKGMVPSGPSNPNPTLIQPARVQSTRSKPDQDRLYQQPRYPSQPASAPRVEKSATLPSRFKSNAMVAPPPTRTVTSPEPLPHLLRIRNLETGYDLSDDPQRVVSVPPSTLADPDPADSPPEPEPSKPTTQAPTTQETAVQKGEVRRRPSCIKRSSTGDLAKRVSWADHHDLEGQVSKYASVAREAQASGRKWEEIRDIYLEQMSGLEILHQQVEQSLEHLRLESEHLERADETIRLQRELLRSTFQEFQRKQLRFQAKVQEALDDADVILSRNPTKKLDTTG
ncbi:hypothetical protein LshimejAT787_0304050 [Lyophyllum shimeji]|uniref:Uncharacterized protein n=1 Tax=Lyophyllum shimeji TaxID=47721 RepID=A0A9P3UK78_LYOSH|nr:hypothetical protein LshimejAT787_0304050 [Lyophyllum shimeji]